jgi:hypothetical protein
MYLFRAARRLLLPTLHAGQPWMFLPCNHCCPVCVACKDKQYPDELTVTFSGVIRDRDFNWGNQPDGCCNSANGSWTIQRLGECDLTEWGDGFMSVVYYHASFPQVPMCNCVEGEATLEVHASLCWNYLGSPGTRAVFASLRNSRGCLSVWFERIETNQAEPFDCVNLDNLALSFQSSGTLCHSPNATCTVSA